MLHVVYPLQKFFSDTVGEKRQKQDWARRIYISRSINNNIK